MMENSMNEMLGDDDGIKLMDDGGPDNLGGMGMTGMEGHKDDNIDHYLRLFRKEVDFHHKVAYRFEKAYRLGRRQTERSATLNIDIIQCITDHSGYIEQDPMALFYCLFFCIQFNNESLVDFLRSLIHKIHSHSKIDKLLEFIDVNGIQRIRTEGEQIK